MPAPDRLGSARWRAALAVVATGLLTGSLVGCGAPDDEATEPTIPAVPFAAALVLEVDGGRVSATDGPSEHEPVSVEPPVVRGGSVLEVRNTGDDDVRLQAGTAFDTGILAPGEAMTVVVVNDGGDDLEHRLRLHEGPDRRDVGVLTVAPRRS